MKCSLGMSDFLEEISATAKLLQSCLTLCDPMDCGLLGSSNRGILQARILEWTTICFSRNLPNLGIEPKFLPLQVDSLPSEPMGKKETPAQQNQHQTHSPIVLPATRVFPRKHAGSAIHRLIEGYSVSFDGSEFISSFAIN